MEKLQSITIENNEQYLRQACASCSWYEGEIKKWYAGKVKRPYKINVKIINNSYLIFYKI